MIRLGRNIGMCKFKRRMVNGCELGRIKFLVFWLVVEEMCK